MWSCLMEHLAMLKLPLALTQIKKKTRQFRDNVYRLPQALYL